MTTDGPLFESSKDALRFALNFSASAAPPTPYMSKAMAEVPASKGKAKDLEEELAKAARQWNLNPGPSLRGLTGAAQAGLIRAQLTKLDLVHQYILTVLMMVPTMPCSCGAPCCIGYRPIPRYVEAFKQLGLLVEQAGDLLNGDDGQKGVSKQPKLWALITEGFISGRAGSLTKLAQDAGVSMSTAAKHREWVLSLLEQWEDEAWLQIDPILVDAGIVGSRA